MQTATGVKCSYESAYDGYCCPLPAISSSGEPYCIFHSSDPNKNPDALLTALRERFEAGNYAFDGCVFTIPVDFRGIEFRRSISFHEAMFQRGATFAGCTFRGRRAVFSRCSFGGIGADFSDAVFRGDELRFDNASFGGERTRFNGCRIASEQATFDRASFHANETDFSQATFAGERVSLSHIDVMSPWVLFEGAVQERGMLLLMRASMQAKMISFEEFHQKAGVLNLQGIHLRGGTVSFAGAMFHGDAVRSERMHVEADRLSWERTQWMLQSGASYRRLRVSAKEVCLADSTASTSLIDFRQSEIKTNKLSFEGVNWEENISFEDGVWIADEVTFRGAHFAGESLRLDGLKVQGRRLRLGEAKTFCNRTCLSGAKLEVADCDLSGLEVEGHHFSAQGLQWTGEQFLLDRMVCRARTVAFNRSRFRGSLLSMQDTEFISGDVSFNGSEFSTDEVRTERLQVRPGLLRLGGVLGSFRFQGWSVDNVDFSGSVWPLTSRYGRPICQDEFRAETLDDLEEVAALYQKVAETYKRGSGPHTPEDFWVASLDCGRLHAGWLSSPWIRLCLEWQRLATGYGTAPWRSTWIWGVVALLATVLAAVIGNDNVILLWPLSLTHVQAFADYLTSLNTVGFPDVGLSLRPAYLWSEGLGAAVMGLFTSAIGYATVASLIQHFMQRRTTGPREPEPAPQDEHLPTL